MQAWAKTKNEREKEQTTFANKSNNSSCVIEHTLPTTLINVCAFYDKHVGVEFETKPPYLSYPPTQSNQPTQTVTSDFLARAQKRDLKAYGPIRMPTKTLRITTRKTPCGEGSKTWSRYQLRIHKRVLDLKSTSEIVKEVTAVSIDPIVTVEVTVDDAMKNKLREQKEMRETA